MMGFLAKADCERLILKAYRSVLVAAMPRYDLPACGYVFDVSVTFGHTQHLGLGFEPIVKSVAGCVPSFFVQLISAFANPVFLFAEAHLAEIEVGGAELNLHDVHLVFRIEKATGGLRWLQ
jgi:hypothetical protein